MHIAGAEFADVFFPSPCVLRSAGVHLLIRQATHDDAMNGSVQLLSPRNSSGADCCPLISTRLKWLVVLCGFSSSAQNQGLRVHTKLLLHFRTWWTTTYRLQALIYIIDVWLCPSTLACVANTVYPRVAQ